MPVMESFMQKASKNVIFLAFCTWLSCIEGGQAEIEDVISSV